uniref:RNA-directed DNA polymerase from mobile element jockey n=1 Tax=Talaromyces marneffei PM1 TaxID=1077442 RepID=A0A093UTM5_TALMA
MVKCGIHYTNHGSDHQAIETEFDISVPDRPTTERLLWKNAPWTEIRARVTTSLQGVLLDGSVQLQTDRLMIAVTEAVSKLTPKAKPSPYAKRWWTTDLTQLRRIYTYWRNQARSRRRAGCIIHELKQQAHKAAKEYHDAIRKQKKIHWEDFLANDANIWQATKYLKPNSSSFSDKIPPLVKADGSTTKDKGEQMKELLATFFPPLPTRIEDEGTRPQREPIHMPDLTMEEIERKVFEAKPWKAPGEDGLLAMVWRQLWPVVKERVFRIFQISLQDSDLPSQWRNAKIIPLKKPAKKNYALAKAWRPISLLSTLGKILEAVIAERILYAVEEFGLLPINHFGARKRRSAEQALLLLQEEIYKAWRNRKVLSLVSFDVQGAYNGVFKERLLQRLKARGIPDQIVRWIDAFCLRRTANILVNGSTSKQRELPQAGLPQGSPLSPILFLFFNADLVQHRISASGGAITFVDDYTAWVSGPSAEANRASIQAIIDRALDWERRSGATFECDKTAIVHFTRTASRSSSIPFLIKGEIVELKESAKILGIVMDSQLRFKEHIANAATKGLTAAMALRRLKMTSLRSTVATAVAKAEAGIQLFYNRHIEKAIKLHIDIQTLPESNPLVKLKTITTQRFRSPLQRIARALETTTTTERIETIQAFTNITVAPTAEWGVRNIVLNSGLGGMRPNIVIIDEYRQNQSIGDIVQREATKKAFQGHGCHIESAGLRFKEHIANAATKGLTAAMALRRLKMTSLRSKHGAIAVTGAFWTVATAVAEAEAGIQLFYNRHIEKAIKLHIDIQTLPESNPLVKLKTITTQRFRSPLQRIARALETTTTTKRIETIQAFTISPWTARIQTIHEKDGEQTIQIAKKAIGILIATSASARSGIVGIGGHIRDTQADNNGTDISSFSITLGKRTEQNPYTAELEAMAVALERVLPGACYRWISILSRTEHLPEKQPSQARSTAIRLALAERQLEWTLPENVGKYSKAVDAALPGKHTRSLYDRLNRKEAKILAQLRTGMTGLNSYLNRIGAADSDLCACGQASETVEHFLFRCTKWTAMREGMNQCTESRRGNLSFFLGGKSRSDPDRWQPDMKAVQAVIKYAIATGRLEQEPEAGPPST